MDAEGTWLATAAYYFVGRQRLWDVSATPVTYGSELDAFRHRQGHEFIDAALRMAEDGGTPLSLQGVSSILRARHARRPPASHIMLVVDKGYGSEDLVNELRPMEVTPLLAQSTVSQRSEIDPHTTRHDFDAASQRIERAFGQIKTVAGKYKSTFCAHYRVEWTISFAVAKTGATAQTDDRGGVNVGAPPSPRP